MAIIKHKDPRNGVTYVYTSQSYWDKEKKQPRSKRTLIGKIDEATGEIVPTGKSGRRKSSTPTNTNTGESATPITTEVRMIAERDAEIVSLKAEIAALKREKMDIQEELTALLAKISK